MIPHAGTLYCLPTQNPSAKGDHTLFVENFMNVGPEPERAVLDNYTNRVGFGCAEHVLSNYKASFRLLGIKYKKERVRSYDLLIREQVSKYKKFVECKSIEEVISSCASGIRRGYENLVFTKGYSLISFLSVSGDEHRSHKSIFGDIEPVGAILDQLVATNDNPESAGTFDIKETKFHNVWHLERDLKTYPPSIAWMLCYTCNKADKMRRCAQYVGL